MAGSDGYHNAPRHYHSTTVEYECLGYAVVTTIGKITDVCQTCFPGIFLANNCNHSHPLNTNAKNMLKSTALRTFIKYYIKINYKNPFYSFLSSLKLSLLLSF